MFIFYAFFYTNRVFWLGVISHYGYRLTLNHIVHTVGKYNAVYVYNVVYWILESN